MNYRNASRKISARIPEINYRSLVVQILILLLFFIVVFRAGSNYYTNITDRNIGIGFDFMDDTAGFSISQTLIPYTEADTFGKTFIVGLLNTLLASIISIVLASFIGFVVGLSLLSQNKLLSGSAKGYIEVLRNIPPLLHVLFWYQVVFLRVLPPFKESLILGKAVYINVRGITVPELVRQPGATSFSVLLFITICMLFLLSSSKKKMVLRGVHKRIWPLQLACILIPVLAIPVLKPYIVLLPQITKFRFSSGITIRPELFSIVFALSTYTATYIAEIVRSSILAVPKGQLEAAKSLGFPPLMRLRLIIIPQSLRTMIPPMTNQYLNIIKNTSLGMAVAYPDLTAVFAGTTLNQTGRALEVMLMVMCTYLVISLFTSIFMNWYNRTIIEKKGALLTPEELEEFV